MTILSRNQLDLLRRVKAFIFDLDDTLVLSTVDFPKFKRLVIEEIGKSGDDPSEYSIDETIVTIIARFEERMRAKGVPENTLRTMLEKMDRIMDEVEMERVNETLPIRGAPELLKYLREKGVRVGVLTRGCESYARAALSKTSMMNLVDSLECRNSETRPKPDPEAYLRLVDRMGVDKQDTIFVGDHPIDAHCARNAGVAFIGVLTGDVPEDELRGAGTIGVFKDAAELLTWLQEIMDY